jgi:hypothetical protein
MSNTEERRVDVWEVATQLGVNKNSISRRIDRSSFPAGRAGCLSHFVLSDGEEWGERCGRNEERNRKHFGEETVKLGLRSENPKQDLGREIKELDRQIREARRGTVLATFFYGKLEVQKSNKTLESIGNREWRKQFNAQDAIDSQRDEVISPIEKQLIQRHALTLVFHRGWHDLPSGKRRQALNVKPEKRDEIN